MLVINVEDNMSMNPDRIKKVEIGQGEIIALLGENGSGKTTLIKQILGMKVFKGGKILLDGDKVTYKNLHKLSLGSCEHTFFGEFTILEQKEFYQIHFPGFKEKRFNLLVEYFELPLKRKMKHMSEGEKNQAETVFALCQGADYIFLDEPFANNDIFRRKDFYKLLIGLLEENETLIIATHLVEEIDSIISRVILVDNMEITGDVSIEELDEEGIEVVEWLKEKLNYNEKKAVDFIKRIEEEL
ncbi:MAG: ATP-binding cassette domain-containing protein [Lachnospiraceae bacterium]|nr:ATP-binding cassette domain-containing protein [Lachnospiraceae bacterium]